MNFSKLKTIVIILETFVVIFLLRPNPEIILPKLSFTDTMTGFTSHDLVCDMPDKLQFARNDGGMYRDTLDHAVLYTLPEKPNADLPIGIAPSEQVKFDPKLGTDDKDLDKPFASQMDIDGDGKNERIILSFLFMTQGPHLAQVIKDDKVIWQFEAKSVSIDQVTEGKPGFYLSYSNNWLAGDYYTVRYIIGDDGLLHPAWQQRRCGLSYKLQ